MRVRLPPCEHQKVLIWRVLPRAYVNAAQYTYHGMSDQYTYYGLCESCFVRVMRDDPRSKWVEAPPVGGGPCTHPLLDIPSKLTANKPYRNAACTKCGAGLRASKGSYDWKPLRDYRFIIEEHP